MAGLIVAPALRRPVRLLAVAVLALLVFSYTASTMTDRERVWCDTHPGIVEDAENEAGTLLSAQAHPPNADYIRACVKASAHRNTNQALAFYPPSLYYPRWATTPP